MAGTEAFVRVPADSTQASAKEIRNVAVDVSTGTSATTRYQQVVVLADQSGNLDPSVQVSGTVSVSGGVTAQVSGTVSVASMPAVSGTVSVSGGVNVSGTVSVSVISTVLGSVNVEALATVDSGNSSTSLLSSTAAFTGAGVTVLQYRGVNIQVTADVAGTLAVQFSPDGVNWDFSDVTNVLAGVALAFNVPILGKFFRVVYTNGAATQTVFRLQAILTPAETGQKNQPLLQTVNQDDLAVPVHAVLVGKSGTAYFDAAITPSGVLAVSATVQGTVSVSAVSVISTIVTILGTAAVTARVSGTVTVLDGASVTIQQGASVVLGALQTVDVTTATVPGAGSTALVVVLKPGASVNIGNLATVDATTATVPGAGSTALIVVLKPGANVTIQDGASVTARVSGTVTGLDGVSVTIQQGASVVLGALATVDVTTGAAGAGSTGLVVVLKSGATVSIAPGASVTVVTQLGTAVVTLATGGSVTLVGTVGVSEIKTALSTVVTILGTAIVTLATGGTVAIIAPGSTTGSSGMSGVLVWLGASQTVIASIPVSQTVGTIIAISGVTAVSAVSTIVTILGTQIVTLATGGTIATLLGVQIVSVTVSAVLGTVITLLGTVAVSAALVSTVGTIIAVSGVTAVSVVSTVGTIVTVLTVVTLLGTVIVTQVGVYTTAMATGASTGLVVVAKDFARIPFYIRLSSTVIGSNTTMLMTIHTGNTFVATGTSAYAVPAGQVLCIYAAGIGAILSAVTTVAMLVLVLGTATASISFTSTAATVPVCLFAATVGTTFVNVDARAIYVSGGTTLCAGMHGGTSCSIVGGFMLGYLF
jgi:hypothetical protein